MACGIVIDNCSVPINCPDTCVVGEVCVGNICECVPDAINVTCAAQPCGQAINNCGTTIDCPFNCPPPDNECIGNL